MIDVIPGIYDKDEAEVRRKIALVAPYVSWIQIDFSDGTLVPKISLTDIAVLEKIIKEYPSLSFEAHLMVDHPEKYVRDLSGAGFKRLIAHVESADPRLFLEEAEYESIEVGMAIDGPTDFEQIEPYLDNVDFVLVITSEMGASGQPFQPETVDKVKQIHENLPDLPIEVDCGINDKTARMARDAGATRLAVTSYLFSNHANSISGAVKSLAGI
jgi:ribulose-phosphate 3-epimerase